MTDNVKIDDMRSALEKLYTDHWKGLNDAISPVLSCRNLSWPLLLRPFPEYLQVKCRLMVVGQQTNEWKLDPCDDWSTKTIIKSMDLYESFFGKPHAGLPFFRASRKLYKSLNPDSPESGFLWNNLYKIDEKGEKSNRPSPVISNILMKYFNVLKDEINIIQPQVVVFFTGPEYDSTIDILFPGNTRLPISGFEERDLLVRVEHPALPKHSFRTYHPRYLCLKKKCDLLVSTITRLAQLDS